MAVAGDDVVCAAVDGAFKNAIIVGVGLDDGEGLRCAYELSECVQGCHA